MSLNNVTSINKFPQDSDILRNIADSIDRGDFKNKGLVVAMITEEGIEVFGSGVVGEDKAIALLERAKHKLITMSGEQ